MNRADVPVVNGQQYRGERRGLLAQTGLTLLCLTMAKCLFHSLHSLSLILCCLQFKGFLSATSSASVSRVCGAPDSDQQQDDIPGKWPSQCERMCTPLCVHTELLCVCMSAWVCVSNSNLSLPMSDVSCKNPEKWSENLETVFKDN